jgi:hypothetical protein
VYVGRDFSPAANSESLVYGLNFVNDVNVTAGEVITGISGGQFSLTVDEGSDSNASSRLIGLAAITIPVGATSNLAVIQRISGLLPDVNYIVRAVVTTSLSNTFELYSHILGENAE